MANPVGSMFGVRDAKGDVSKEKRVLYEDGLYLEFMVFNIIHIGPSGLETVHGGVLTTWISMLLSSGLSRISLPL